MKCRFCNNELKYEFIDLINSPPSNSFLTKEQLNEPELFFPLKIFICDKCFLVQTDEYKKSEDIFSKDYIYFSSYSTSWLKHCKEYVEMMCNRFNYNDKSFIIEIASNDGYLLQYFKDKKIPILGIEPAFDTAQVASDKGINTLVEFFNSNLAKKLVSNGSKADLILGNNVLAHVPDINDFVEGIKILLKDTGVFTFEFPHLMQLVENNQFDTIYHEHFSYLSFYTVDKIFSSWGLQLFDVDEISTHGGSLRIYGKHKENKIYNVTKNVSNLLEKEKIKKMQSLNYYKEFQFKSNKIKYNLIKFLIDVKEKNKVVVGYGAAAKGNTLLNYAGIKNDLIEYVVDKSPHKQGKYLPASHIPVFNECEIKKTKPDYIIIFPWNVKEEIITQLKYVKDWDCKFVTFIPELNIV